MSKGQNYQKQDYRIPHANARFNHGDKPRVVVYIGLLPHVPLNAQYAAAQLEKYCAGIPPNDQWKEKQTVPDSVLTEQPPQEEETVTSTSTNETENNDYQPQIAVNVVSALKPKYEFSNLGEKLMGITPW